MVALQKQKITPSVVDSYTAFDALDGEHPWMTAVPEGFVPYQVRELGRGEIAYFNYALAREMGLIPRSSSDEMNPFLKQKLIQTFSIQIINEYDEMAGRKFDPSSIKPKKYMASRYLQLQHKSKTGKTSGDGRGIWNGTITHRGQIWDVSSRGTGVTCLAPGAVEAGKPLQTGGTDFGYGCGLAEIDELYGAAMMAEILHLQGISTERVLCVIDLGNGHGIGVRAAQNLLRPAHLFLYLKQGRYSELKAGFDYLIDRQIKNRKWQIKTQKNKYQDFVEHLAEKFAEFTAVLDVDYIFAWLDWDGDNVLADAGIIDYGSVRQFGIRHDKYRYDDVERFSTNLNEQKKKAQLIVQVFCQIADQLTLKQHGSVKSYATHPTVLKFLKSFEQARAHRLLYRMGFNPEQRQSILSQPGLFKSFDQVFCYFERAKISGTTKNVPDGVNHPALFDLRPLHRELPKFLYDNTNPKQLDDKIIFKMILSNFAKSRDARIRPKHSRMIELYQKTYAKMIKVAAASANEKNEIRKIAERAAKLNDNKRLTGNALIEIVDEILLQKKRGTKHETIQAWMEQFIFAYLDLPEVQNSQYFKRGPRALQKPEILEKLMKLVELHKHDI